LVASSMGDRAQGGPRWGGAAPACGRPRGPGGVSGGLPPTIPSLARFRRRRTLLRCARFACAPPTPLACPLLPQKDTPSLRALRSCPLQSPSLALLRRRRTLLHVARFARAPSNPDAARSRRGRKLLRRIRPFHPAGACSLRSRARLTCRSKQSVLFREASW
jgi:hypothetical protein